MKRPFPVKLHFALNSYDELAQRLVDLDIRHFDKSILAMQPDELLDNFGTNNRKRIEMTIYIRNILWQLYEQIQAGNPPPFYHRSGLIRDIWYHIRKATSRHRLTQGDHEDLIDKQLTLLVTSQVLTYHDFNLDDAHAPWRSIGQENPHIFFIAEKRAFFPLMQTFQEDTGIHIASLGGVPSLLSVNYWAGEMAAAGLDMKQQFQIYTLVDYDPGGLRIATSFAQHLKDSGVTNFRMFHIYKHPHEWCDLNRPANFPPDKLQAAKNMLPAKERKYPSTKAWRKETGGVDGTLKWTLYVNEFTDDVIHDLVERFIVPELKTSKEILLRKRTIRNLEKALKDLLLYKVLQEQKAEKS